MDERAFWDALARVDPLWAVLSDPSKAGRRWRLDDFMRVGEREIAKFELTLSQAGLALPSGTALDFGCAVGRLTQAFARRFTRVVGIDISPEMLALANRLNRYPSRVEYVLNEHDDLRAFADGTFDLIYSNIVLQHVPPEAGRRLVGELVRVLAAGGLLFFQVPSHPTPAPAAAIRVMPQHAYRATVEFAGEIPRAVVAGTEHRIDVAVTNTSDWEWRQEETGAINAGNHWLDADGRRVLVQDDTRASLPLTMAAGRRHVVDLNITAPDSPGVYTLEIDVVHEQVTWFGHGARCCVDVLDAGRSFEATRMLNELSIPDYRDDALAGLDPAPALVDLPRFPMYGIPVEEVTGMIAAHGGEIIRVDDDTAAGSDWQSYRYLVRRA